ncbi:unnamed protein product [Haemonchus placei]|uniref:Uncharacterized protein n=1 Tax=Haemonchus placei TaxID=6290 RepID=A0A3P7YIL7_HAEPC|nr:unnamed protein product [Haemonchus placei]
MNDCNWIEIATGLPSVHASENGASAALQSNVGS